MPNTERGTWVGIVGPDGSGKSALVDELLAQFETDGLDVAHTHGRPQSVARRTPPAHADPSRPHAAQPRGPLLSLAKYLLAVLDFLVTRRRLLGRHDVWLCERPLLDYEVDPARYQLDDRILPVVRRLNTLIPGPDTVLLLSGDAQTMADRKGELAASEIDRQLQVWRRVTDRIAVPTHTLDTTSGDTVPEIATSAAETIRSPRQLRWRAAPVKPTRLDVRFAGRDTSALDVYRPIRFVARAADGIGRGLTKLRLTPRAPSPDPAIDALIHTLRTDGWPITGVSAMASSTKNRWIVGLANAGRLSHVLKVGPQDDNGLARELANLQRLQTGALFDSVYVPPGTRLPSEDRLVVAFRAAQGTLTPVVRPDDAVIAATELAEHGWTHGDFAPWNLFRDESSRLVLLDWEDADQTVRPLWDITHYLCRLGSTTHPSEAKAAFADLTSSRRSFNRLLEANQVEGGRSEIRRHISSYLTHTEEAAMSPREREFRRWMRVRARPQGRNSK